MDQLSAQKNTKLRVQKRGKQTFLLLYLRFLLAFIVGWLFALLVVVTPLGSAPGFILSFTPDIFLVLLPLILGIAVSWTVDKGHRHLISLSAGTGIFAAIGAYVYLLPLSLLGDAQTDIYCARHECHLPSGMETAFLTFLFFLMIVLIFLGAGVAGFIRKRGCGSRVASRSGEN